MIQGEKIKIVHICLGGIYTENSSYQENILAKYHKKLGLDTIIIADTKRWSKEGKIEKVKKGTYINELGIKIYRIESYINFFIGKKLGLFKNLSYILFKEKPDFIFLHGIQYLDSLKVIRYLKEYKNTKIYVDNHADFSNSATNWVSKFFLHRILWRYCAKKINPYVEKFYGVLPARVDFLKDVYKVPEDKVDFLPLGADDEYIGIGIRDSIKIRKKYKIDKEDFLIVTGGKIDLFKSQILLLMKAVKNIKEINVKLLIFGSIDAALEKEFLNLLMDNKIIYVGWIEAIESYSYFAAANLVVFPGRHSVFWEQVVGQGVPLLCKYWKGTTHVDLGGNCRFLYDDNVETIEKEINVIIKNKNIYADMKDKACQYGPRFFSYKNIAKKSIDMEEKRKL